MNPSATGASNAQDFQPPTQNPQSNVLPSQQQPSSLQNPAVSEILNKEDARIIVPGGLVAGARTDSRPEAVVGHNYSGIFFVLGLLVVLVGVALLFQRRKKPSVEPIPAPTAEVVPKQKPPKKPHKKPKHKRKKK